MEKKDAFNDTALIAENETNNEININNAPKDTQELIVKKLKKILDKQVKLKDRKTK